MKLKKPHFNNFSEDINGPYYDPYDGHIHNWKNSSLIKNFTGEQSPRFEEYSIDTSIVVKNGEYCCICHKRKGGFVTKPINKVDTRGPDRFRIPVNIQHDINIQYDINISNSSISKSNNNNEPLLLYKLNNHESLYIRQSEMTYYQKFKYMNPNYKNEISFIINNTKFCNNYYIIYTS